MSSEKNTQSPDQRVERASVHTSDGNENLKPDAAHVAEAQAFAATWVDGTDEEKRLRRKLDWRILPCTWTLYLLGFLDRANIG
jgi:hypothetical protein